MRWVWIQWTLLLAVVELGSVVGARAASVQSRISHAELQADQSERLLDSFYAGAEFDREFPRAGDRSSRLYYYAQIFLRHKSPYLENPLGEGREGQFSRQPLYRFDGFDCTTFVETIMALALSYSSEEFKRTLNEIRYKDGQVDYVSRNHFPSLDWIPNNSKMGFVEDITGEVGGRRTLQVAAAIDKASWYKKKGPAFQEVVRQNRFKVESVAVPYLSKEDLLRNPSLIQSIPSGSIFHVVRKGWNVQRSQGTEMTISHMGFLFWEKDVLYMIHASNGLRDGSDDYRGVKKEPLAEYLFRVMMKSPTMVGLNILQVAPE
ncbi:MAG: N-acetylmuramoyl-L-alanine amidase-like domain-containing protein [Bdellovibrio sp.]